ncbi:phosphonate C-P lyase system protein PhnG [Methylococcus sp. ANG]|uniref:phosphonate C-P lyase system protein PhnG n=1 Tax=unclassified Methylococcus TaxID=2618889 RepID=UPI001C528F95|nr:phosphonate C-P lyase system protein PhnG [Methylococcus sp. Mc7]QXP85090.1 phosphonate C-P lyase system protein PhnG [Methylococcus sp. Mc7]
MTDIERRHWLRALTALPPETLAAVAGELDAGWAMTYKTRPQAGLGMLQLRDGALHEAYYLGEFPLAHCWLTLSGPDGESYQGAAQVMADDPDLARALAVLDAVLAHRLPGWERVSELVETGQAARAEEDRIRARILAATRVDFTLLSATEAGDDD